MPIPMFFVRHLNLIPKVSPILCIGRLDDPRKRIEVLGEAFAVLAERGDSVTNLVLAGKSVPLAEFWRSNSEKALHRRVT